MSEHGSLTFGSSVPRASAPMFVVGRGCGISPYAIVGHAPMQSVALAHQAKAYLRAWLGDRVMVGPFAIIYAGASIDDETMIGDHAHVREGVRIGKRCMIGQGVSIQYDAEIGDEVRILNGTHITGGMKIGRGTFIGVGVVTSNDKRREIVDYQWAGVTPPVIGERCLIGSAACIIPGVRIGDGAVIGAGALVTKDVPAGVTVLGEPARRNHRAGEFAAQAQPLCHDLNARDLQEAFG